MCVCACVCACVCVCVQVIMERDTYPRRWGLGPIATKKKQMIVEVTHARTHTHTHTHIHTTHKPRRSGRDEKSRDEKSRDEKSARARAQGKLDKFGRANDKTPGEWQKAHPDLAAAGGGGKAAKPAKAAVKEEAAPGSVTKYRA